MLVPRGLWPLLSYTWSSFNCHLQLSSEQSSPIPSPALSVCPLSFVCTEPSALCSDFSSHVA